MVLLITYDLNTPGKKYDELYEAIKKTSTTWWHYLDSTWLIETSLSPQQVWEQLTKHVDKNDSVLIIRVANNPRYSGWLEQKAWDWINNKIY